MSMSPAPESIVTRTGRNSPKAVASSFTAAGRSGSPASKRGTRCTLVPMGSSSSISATWKVPSELPVHSTDAPPLALRERMTMVSATMKQLSRPIPNWPR